MTSALSEDTRTRDIRLNHARLLPLRILYTINSSPQYILARSHKPAVVSPIPRRPLPNSYYPHSLPNPDPVPVPVPGPSEEHYATTSLKICLDAICCSSPELVQDDTRDFSVYVLDPLESQSTPAPVHIPRNALGGSSDAPAAASAVADQHPRGVAVGLGLMSWALLADQDDCVSVTGTLIPLGNGQEALQVIFALRETAAMRRAALSSKVKSWGLPPPPSNRTRVHASKSHHSSKHTASASSPFQPSNASQTIYSKTRASQAPPAPATSHLLDSHSVYIGPPKRPVGRPETGRGKTKTGKRDENSPPERQNGPSQAAPSVMDVLSAISSSGQNTALLSALSTIDASSVPDPALIDALKQLLSASSPPDPRTADNKPQDDDIVLLDKENVNPTAFRRRGERDDGKTTAPPARALLSPGSRENSSPGSGTRKRTLSEFMDERGRGGHRGARSLSRSRSRPQTSPARPVRADEHAVGSSPARPRKRFVVPEWAKTDSAMRPRLSKGAEGRVASPATDGKEKDEKRSGRGKKGKGAARGGGRRWQRVERASTPTPTPTSTSTDGSEGEGQQSAVSVLVSASAPVAAAARLPVFASSISVGSFLATPTRGPPRTPPPRRRAIEDEDEDEDETLPSLFTPAGGCTAGSPLFTPGFHSSPCARNDDEDEDEVEVVPQSSLPETSSSEFGVEHWSGLPPSSPPPPSSPAALPADEGTSVADFGGTFDDLSSLFCAPADGGGETGVGEFDFTEFWASVKPLAEGEPGTTLEVDHVKLAEEVQALFSGCLM